MVMKNRFIYYFHNQQESVSTLSDCFTDILFWMESSTLKLNPEKKTDLLLLALSNNEIGSSAIFELNCLAVIHRHQMFVI